MNDILLLLKSSEFVTHDLMQPFCSVRSETEESVEATNSPKEPVSGVASGGNLLSVISDSDCKACHDDCNDRSKSKQVDVLLRQRPSVEYCLVLREWQSISPIDEFRCFVAIHHLVAISQRHDSVYFPSLMENMPAVADDIKQFYNKYICRKFSDESYTFDVWRRATGDVLLIDFNPFTEVTDPLLFSWTELREIEHRQDHELQVRCVENEMFGINSNPYQKYGYPVDLVDLTSGTDMAKFMDLIHMPSLVFP